jgi:hypothetical protein
LATTRVLVIVTTQGRKVCGTAPAFLLVSQHLNCASTLIVLYI